MESAVCFRDFEERDIDFVYKCKNNEKLWEYAVGEFHKFSYEEAVEWVHGCMRDDPTYKFWAICKNNGTREIVGWCSIAKINHENKSAELHGIVIGDIEYHDGFTWIEAGLFVSKYVFENLQFDILFSRFLSDHPITSVIDKAYSKNDIVIPNAVIKDSISHDLVYTTFKKEDYFALKETNGLKISSIITKILQNRNRV